MLIDRLRVDFKSGKGGNGVVRFWIGGKPCGGNGGRGGNVYLEGSSNLYDLKTFVNKRVLEAGDGEMGTNNLNTGRNGADLIVKVPLTTVVYSLNNDKLLTIERDGERKLLIEGVVADVVIIRTKAVRRRL